MLHPSHFSWQKSCLLTYNGTSGTTGTYAVALTLEDFPAGTTNFVGVTPFSAVGLQFLVIISSYSGSCNNVPVFTPSTPNDGECTEVQTGSVYKTVIEVTLADFSKQWEFFFLVIIRSMMPSSPYFCAVGNARKGKRKDWSEAKNGEFDVLWRTWT